VNNGVIPPGKILIIDDDEEDYLILRDRLRDTRGMRWASDWASTYEQASEKLFGPGVLSAAYQAVVVDYHMGLHSGLDLIRKAGEKNLDAPFILITGQGNLDVDEEALRAGASLYLTKEEANSALLERTIRYAIELRQKELALKMSERQLRNHSALVDHMHDAVVASDANYIISSWNPAAEALYGWKAEEVIGHPGLDLLQTQFPDPDKQSMLAAIAEMGYWRGEVTQIKRGKIIGYLSVNRDITDRKIAEARIAVEQEWLRTTLVSIGDAVITCDPQGTVTFLNPVAEEITGWSNGEAAGQPLDCVFQIINEQTLERQSLPLASVLESAQVVGLPGQIALIKRDGRMIPIEDSTAPIRDPGGEVLGVVIVFQDVSARRESERILREAEERFHIALSNSSIAVFSTDLNLRYTWFYSTSMGNLPARMIGNRDDEVLPLEQVAEFMEVKRRVIETRSVVRDEVQVARTDELMVLDVSIEPLI
jgi:PAS domain S-box-containing protein